jgi:hypothetical protein
MKPRLLNHLILFFALSLNAILGKANDTTQIFISTNYSFDLSDTYSGGELFSGEFTFSKSWYGIKAAFGHFQSQYIYVFKVPYPEIERTLFINIPEMAMMKIGTISGFFRPIHKNWFTADLVFGASYGRAKCFYMKSVDYEYLLAEDRFTHLFVDYYLHKVNYFGYHAGLDLSFNFTKKIGIQVCSRIHDMSNGGTFFFVGGGMVFKIK